MTGFVLFIVAVNQKKVIIELKPNTYRTGSELNHSVDTLNSFEHWKQCLMIEDLNSIDLFFCMLFDGNNGFDHGSVNLYHEHYYFEFQCFN